MCELVSDTRERVGACVSEILYASDIMVDERVSETPTKISANYWEWFNQLCVIIWRTNLGRHQPGGGGGGGGHSSPVLSRKLRRERVGSKCDGRNSLLFLFALRSRSNTTVHIGVFLRDMVNIFQTNNQLYYGCD